MNVLQYIKQNYDSFTDSEKLIADYLLETKESIITMSAKDIAGTTKTSAPTVVRFAKNIYIFSVGVSALVGQDFYYKLSRINKRCISHTDTHLQITTSVLMEPGDVAITKASVNNKIADISDVVLRVPAVEKSLREGAISSRISQLAIVDMLFIGMARNNIKEVEEKLIKTRKAVKELYK